MEDIPQDINVNPTDQPPGIGVSLNLSDIEILRDRIEQQKANKLKAEQLVSTLSKIKAREKASRRSIKPGEKKIEDGVLNQTTKRSGTNSSSALKEKSNLLKKKLEEDRAKLESKKGQDDLGKVSQIVEHIRVQLEDQDKTIQQMHSSFVTTKPQPVEEVKSLEPDIPQEVKQRIADLEMKIIDLQENLREKDSVISARTQAITLLSEDMARKGKNTLDTLEETRTQMKTMQANFIALEDRMNEERVRLKEELEAKKLRLQQVEKNYRTAESARFELSTQIAGLQEKIVAFQTKNIALEKEVSVSEVKLKELQEALENNNKQTLKMKAQFKAKLKALEEERDLLKKEEKTNDELNRLRERIAELEDEKEAGNLLKERVAEMEEKLQRQESDLDSHIKAIASLESEKLDLIEEANKRNILLKEKDKALQSLYAQIKEMEETKISSEMKCVELEEKLYYFAKIENDNGLLHSELEQAKKKLFEGQEKINELSMKLENQRSDICDMNKDTVILEETNYPKIVQEISSNLTEWQARYSALEETLNNTLAHSKEIEDKKKALEEENDQLIRDCNNFKSVVDRLESLLTEKSNPQDNESIVLKQSMAQKEIEISNLKEHNKSLESEIDNLRHSLESTTAELHRLSQQLEDFNSAQQKMEELSAIIDNKNSELEQTSSELEKRTRKLSEYKKFHKLKSEDVIRISHELETVTLSYQQRINELESALSDSQRTEEILRKEIKELKEGIGKTQDEIQDAKCQEQLTKIKKLAASVKLKTKLIKDLEAKIVELESSLQEKDVGPGNYKPCKTGDNDPNRDTIKRLEEKCNILETEIGSLKESLKLKEQELEILQNSSSDQFETITHIKNLENQNKKLNVISETKSEQLMKMEEEISELNGLNKSLLSELEQMQETYKQDALKNECVLDSFENEMLGNKKDILDLSKQLKEVTTKYEQTWAKLQEKEGYIEELEKQLEKVRLRLLHIESTVEERRRSLEERTEVLGARLCEAEKNNEQLEKHEGELERKINYLLDTEEMMGNIIQKLQEENVTLSKSAEESLEKSLHLSKSLENESNKVHHLTKEISDLQITLANYQKLAEDYEISKAQLKDTQCSLETQQKYFENRLTETEHCLEAEIQILLTKVAQLEAERQDFVGKYDLLLIEKQKLEEELGQLQQTIDDVTREELEQLKTNHKNLAEEMNKELEKRQAQIYKIQELEIELANQKNKSESLNIDCNQEISSLKNELDKEFKEKEMLRFELLKEKAKKQVDDVVSKAEETYFNMNTKHDKVEDLEPILFFQESNNSLGSALPLTQNLDNNKSDGDEINKLKLQLLTLDSENQTLKLRLQELELHGQSGSVNMPECDDWTAITKDDDDGWGWGSKDALLEHEHLQKQQFHTELESKMLECERKLCMMEEENKRLSDELKASQTKCNKLIKKVKEFKNKSDSLERNSREKSVGFDDLDFAMQEELRSQVEKLEKSLKECSTNLSFLQSEREGFLKRVDVLTSANERLVEMKERQDVEVEMWQRRSNELQNKVQGLEWTIAELRAEHSESEDFQKSNLLTYEERQQFLKSALEMEEKLNMLAAENDYLQSLIVELKDKDKKDNVKEELAQHAVDFNDHLCLKQENYRLNCLLKTIEEEKNTNLAEYSHEIEELKNKNAISSSEIENLRCHGTAQVKSNDEFSTLSEKYNALLLENERLNSTISSLNEELVKLKNASDSIKDNKKILSIDQCTKENELANLIYSSLFEDEKVEHNSNSQVTNDNETPLFFRGFTSSDNNSIFDVSIGIPENLVSHADKKLSNEHDVLSSDTIKNEFFGKAGVAHGSEENIKDSEFQLAEITSKFAAEFPGTSQQQIEISQLKTKLSEKDSEVSFLNANLKKFEDEINNLKNQLNREQSQNPKPWVYVPSSELSADKSSFWGNELNISNEQVRETELSQKLKSNNEFDDSFGDLFSQEENQECQVNHFVEQITQLTRILHDKEVEIEELNDKKEKYKEMYNSLVKDYDLRSPDSSNSDRKVTCENMALNQLLEDKETELEIMSQQIEQTIVAKENLEDELCLKLCEMEAANNAYASPKSHSDILVSPSEPENIEDVRTLCAEVSELTKLLQEKESEVEILKQQLDEINLEKENLIDEWKKTIEEYKLKYDFATEKAEHVQKELETYKAADILGAETLYKKELQSKDQQIMNIMNDLSNTNILCQDLQAKLNEVEDNLKLSQMQNENLITELNYLKQSQNSLQEITQGIEGEKDLALVEKVQSLMSNLQNIKETLTEAELDILKKENTISALKEKLKLFESSNNVSEKPQMESYISSVAMKTFATEPFRISTEQSSSDDDSSSRQMETSQGQMLLLKEIQSLKQVLSMKDSEITRMSLALNDAQENLIRGEMRFINSEEASLRHRLDEALYTLHLRDVRCDELELELMQLLEERDSLQLRLSTAIRFNEELRQKSQLLDEAELCIEDKDKVHNEEKSQQLKLKLDQLHNVGYRRDPTMQQDQQKRHQEQMHLYTHTTSQDDSQTSGFFNWIFGASSSGSQDV